MSRRALPPGSPTRRFWYHVARSTYVTALTDWFLGFVGKAAHLILILTTLYTGAELLPGVELPAPVSNGVFIVQMLALDVGGIGLAKLAMQAKDQGNDTGARQAENLSTWLIRIVIASLVTVALEQAIRAIPGLTGLSTAVEGVNIAVGGALTIARAICAVHYGRVMHLLHSVDELPPIPVVDVEELVRKAISDLVAMVLADQRQALVQMQQDIESHLKEAIAHAILPHLEAMLDKARSQSPFLSEPQRSLEARMRATNADPVAPILAPDPRLEPEDQCGSQSSEPLAPTLVPAPRPEPEAGASGSLEARLRAAYEQLTGQGQRISGRALAKEAHVKRATASRWLTEVIGQRSEPGVMARASRSLETMVPEQQNASLARSEDTGMVAE